MAFAVGSVLLIVSALVVSGASLRAPDTSSPPVATTVGTINNWNSVGQSFRVERNGLSRIEVVLAAAGRSGDQPLRFYVRENISAEPIRTVLVDQSLLPVGDPWQFVPGRIDEKWFGFDFEPIPDSAGKQFYFSLEGSEIPREGSVKILMFFHNRYREGQAYLSEEPVNAHVVFRAYSSATAWEALRRIVANLVQGKPGILANPILYGALSLIYLALLVILLRKIWSMVVATKSER